MEESARQTIFDLVRQLERHRVRQRLLRWMNINGGSRDWRMRAY